MTVRSAVVGLACRLLWRLEGQANSREVWLTIGSRSLVFGDGPSHDIGVRLTPDQARELAHALIIEADVAQFGAPK